jgi:anti-anti-sigma factor
VSEFTVRIDRFDATTKVVCKGEIDVITSGQFREAVEKALAEGPRRLELDLSNVDHVSAAGVKTLVQTAASIQDSGVQSTWSFSEPARRILDLVGLWWLGVVDDVGAEQHTLPAALRAYAKLRFSDRWNTISARTREQAEEKTPSY